MPIQHILIVDDSPTDRQFLSELLTLHGYTVSTADSAEAAMQKIRSSPPQLVLMDIVMPGQNGFHATREIAKDPATRDLPVIICTSKQQDSDRIWGMRQGASDYLTKPVEPELLLQKIAALSRSGA